MKVIVSVGLMVAGHRIIDIVGVVVVFPVRLTIGCGGGGVPRQRSFFIHGFEGGERGRKSKEGRGRGEKDEVTWGGKFWSSRNVVLDSSTRVLHLTTALPHRYDTLSQCCTNTHTQLYLTDVSPCRTNTLIYH